MPVRILIEDLVMHNFRQSVLNHCRIYFKNRYLYYGGKTRSGWGDPQNPDDRCALASMLKESYETDRDFKSQMAKFYRVSHTDNLLHPDTFYGKIIRFNDLHSGYSQKCNLSLDEVDTFLSSLAAKYDLEYEPLSDEHFYQAWMNSRGTADAF